MNQAWKIEVEGRALNEALRRGVIALGWPKLGDLRAYPDEKAIKIKLSEYTTPVSYTHLTLPTTPYV